MLCFFVECLWRVYAGTCPHTVLCSSNDHVCAQAVGASIRIFQLLDRVSEIEDGIQVLDAFKGGTHSHMPDDTT